ncbi:MAG: hypothetical protein H0U44_12685 [Flavisolibacter sp.]|jgi:hypothetical protein|nr:hypothetical protein [Flavisolibacter sp.]
MRKSKTKTLLLALMVISSPALAQLKLPVTNNELRINLQVVVSDFPRHFINLKGAVINQNPQTVEYVSLLKFDSAEEHLITEYKGTRSIYSWQALLLSTEEFEVAKKKYTWLCNQLKVMTLTLDGEYSFSLKGTFDAPDESKVFSATVFTLTPLAAGMPKIKIEAGLQFQFPEWKVQLLVYEKEREDNERGAIID